MTGAARNTPPGLPNLVIIGAMKAGTTSLHYYLNLHPQIAMSKEKELHFFVAELNWRRGLEWYRSQFSGDALVRGEASPSYTSYPMFEGVAERMHALIPEAGLIYLVRDPIERLLSHYLHKYCDGTEKRQLADVLKDLDSSPYVWRSRYHAQLEEYLKYFPREKILVLSQDDLYTRRGQTLREVFRFLDVDETFTSRRFSSLRHESRYKRRKGRLGFFLERSGGDWLMRRVPYPVRGHVKSVVYFPFSCKVEPPVLEEGMRCELEDVLREDANRLREYTGRAFEGWCV